MNTELIALLKYIHGTFNISVFLLCCYQGWLGWTIRRTRELGLAPVTKTIKRHRRIGPIFAVLGIVGVAGGFIIGLTLHRLTADHHFHIIHLSLALFLAFLIILTFLSSKKIKGVESPWRPKHAILGLCLLGLYCIQVMVGLSILQH